MTQKTWTVDRNIPVALLGALIVNSAVCIWWVAKADSRIASVEKEVEKTSSALARLEDTTQEISKSVAVINARIQQMQSPPVFIQPQQAAPQQ